METFIYKLKNLRKQSGLSQAALANVLGVSRRSYHLYEKGERLPDSTKMEILAKYFNVSLDWLLLGDKKTTNKQPAPPIPLIGFARCGLKDWYEETHSLVTTTPRPADMDDTKAFAIVAQGTSMQPEGIKPGFICICSPNVKYTKGDAIFIQNTSGAASIKTFIKEDDNWLELQGYLTTDTNGNQKPYIEKHRKNTIDKVASVVYVKRKV